MELASKDSLFSQIKSRFYYNNWSCIRLRIIFFTRAIFMIILLICGITNSVQGWAVQTTIVNCVTDSFFDLSVSINSYFIQNAEIKNHCLIVCSLLADLLLSVSLFRYLFWGKSSSQFLFFLLFYPLSGVIQLIFRIQLPEGHIWDSPDFPSLLVSYDKTANFYYCTYAGVLMFFIIENYYFRNFLMLGISCIACVYTCILTIFLRGDYSVSVISGVVMAHYFWLISKKISEKIDPLIGFSLEEKNRNCN